MIVETIWFHQVDDIETILLASACIGDPEVVPLSVAPRVIIRLQDQIVLIFINLDRTSQVTRFETRFEEQSVILSTRRDVKRRHITSFSCVIRDRSGVG